jgi:hypothetical protein
MIFQREQNEMKTKQNKKLQNRELSVQLCISRKNMESTKHNILIDKFHKNETLYYRSIEDQINRKTIPPNETFPNKKQNCIVNAGNHHT